MPTPEIAAGLRSHSAWKLWLLRLSVWGVLFVGLVLVVIIALGLTNPKPIGNVVLTATPAQIIEVPDAEARVYTPSEVILSTPGSVLVVMQQTAGPPEASYGITLNLNSDQPAEGISLQVSTNGLIAVNDGQEAVMLSQLWPHIRPQPEFNELRFDVAEEDVAVWVNDEFAVTFDYSSVDSLQLGFITKTLGRGGLVVRVERITVTQR